MTSISLKSNCGGRIDLEVDLERGRVAGPDAASFLAFLKQWDGNAVIYGTQPVYAPDPLHSLPDLAAVLATAGYILSADLAALLPPPEEIPEGAIA